MDKIGAINQQFSPPKTVSSEPRHCDDWIASFVEYASYGEAPFKVLFWTGISTIAGALRRKVWIEQRFFQWVPNFYIFIVAPPGVVSKSTTINIGLNLLRENPDILFGPDVITWQALVQHLDRSRREFPDPETGELFQMSAITIGSDELGTFLDPHNREMVDTLVSLWDGKRGTYTKLTKTSGNDSITNPWINLIGCTTPSWLGEHMPEHMVGGGFVSRAIFVYADEKRQLVPYVDESVPPDFEEKRRKLIADLERIAGMFGPFRLEPEAREWGHAWYAAHWANYKPETGEMFLNYLSRKQTHIHKLAMVLSAAQRDDRVITRKHLESASDLLTGIEADRDRIFARVGQNDIARTTALIIDRVGKFGKILKSDLYGQLYRVVNIRDFDIALQSACAAGFCEIVQEGRMLFVVRSAAG